MRLPLLHAGLTALLATVTGAASSATLAQPAIDAARTASSATVLLAPPMAIYRQPLDEAALSNVGCRYRTSDPAAIAALVQLLRDADIRDSEVYQRPDAREAVYLSLADGSRVRFLFADNHGGRSAVPGTVESASGAESRSGAVVAGNRLSAALREWTATRGGVGSGGVGSGEACARQSGIATP